MFCHFENHCLILYLLFVSIVGYIYDDFYFGDFYLRCDGPWCDDDYCRGRDLNERKMFSLGAMAYFACPTEQQNWYNSKPNGVIRYELDDCCKVLLESIVNSIPISVNNSNIRWQCICSIRIGHLDCFKVLHHLSGGFPEPSYPHSRDMTRMAAAGGYLDCLQYLIQSGYPMDEITMASAAGGGHIDCLRYLYEKGCPWNKLTCRYAALGGHIESLRYAHENGCPWNEYTCMAAAKNGHLECLTYAHEMGCPCSIRTTSVAEIYDQIACLTYLNKHGFSKLPRHLRPTYDLISWV